MAKTFEDFTEEELAEYLVLLQEIKVRKEGRPWWKTARPKQFPPEHPKHHLPDENGFKCGCNGGDTDYRIWLFLGGRGTGKTITGANWIIEQALAHPKTKWGVASSTASELESVCFRGDSGILSQALQFEITDYNQNKLRILFRNGSEIQGYSADSPDRIRGANLHGLWYDEAASSRYPEFWYASARPAVRLGNARILVTTTPRPTKLLRDLTSRDDGSVHITTGTMFENPHLDAGTKADLEREYGKSRIGRQELYGELLDDFEGALFNRADLDAHRVDEPPALTRIVVGVDPAMKSGESHDESGIVVVGEGEGPDGERHAYVLDDRSMRGTPRQVMAQVASAFHKWQADCAVVETNQGGQFVTDTLRTVDNSVPVRAVHATRGKVVRAEPVSTLAEQGKLHLVGAFPALEDQLCLLIPGESTGENDDRSDAMIWAMYELRHLSQGSYRDAYAMRDCECGATIPKTETKCKTCGAEYAPELVKLPEADPRLGWSEAYVRRCTDCRKLYPKTRPLCPACHPDPSEYLKRVKQLSGEEGKAIWKRENYRQMWKAGI